MTQTGTEYRLDGIYPQRQPGFFMQRVKLAAGVLSAEQARIVAGIADRFGRGMLHLTSRGSMEIHWLSEPALPQVKRELARVGLTARGACGGAVRGVTCGSQAAQAFPLLEPMAARIHRYFTGNPRYERLPKKFKIGLESSTSSGRHLIQDVGLVLSHRDQEEACFDIWIAGGLGREPRPGFLLEQNVAEERVIPIIEAILNVYVAKAPPPKRLKFLAQQLGEDELVRLISAEASFRQVLPPVTGIPERLAPEPAKSVRIEVRLFAGCLTSDELRYLAAFSEQSAGGVLMVTTNQDIAFHVPAGEPSLLETKTVLREKTRNPRCPHFDSIMRVCPGNHECRMGLTATRDLAGDVLAALGDRAGKLHVAIAGCPNSCTQPQLADLGIIAVRLIPAEDGSRTPRYDIYQRVDAGFGHKVRESLTHEELMDCLASPG